MIFKQRHPLCLNLRYKQSEYAANKGEVPALIVHEIPENILKFERKEQLGEKSHQRIYLVLFSSKYYEGI